MTKELECERCGVTCKVSADTLTVTCSYCVNELIGLDSVPVKRKIGYPKGWRFMKEFVHLDGTVYHKGVEQPELKGKLKPTVIEVKPKATKKEKAEQKQSLIEEYAALKKKLKLEKRKTARKKIELRLSKIAKLI